jgi:hypothetical protein
MALFDASILCKGTQTYFREVWKRQDNGDSGPTFYTANR